jgi:uncharacterized protein (TIGR03083 family)
VRRTATWTIYRPADKTRGMDRMLALSVLEIEAERILTLVSEVTGVSAGINANNAVPTCPGWTLEQIPNHLGRVYAMVATVLQGDSMSPPNRDKIPLRPEGQSPNDWMRQRLHILIPLLRDVPEDTRRWNFATGPGSPVGFWWRRQAHETLIHRVDAELAAGATVTTADPEVAADGVGDFLTITGLREVGRDEIRLGQAMTVHLHATDAGPEAEWTIETANGNYARSHLKADVALRGPAWSLDRWCWRRTTTADEVNAELLETFGDVRAADEWRPKI